MKIAFDVGGVLSKYPQSFIPFAKMLQGGGAEVYILSDTPMPALFPMIAANGLDWIPPERIISANYAMHGEECKAVACRELGIEMLVDDFLGYLAVPGAPPIRLLVMPDASLDYYHPEWKTDGTEGAFGRRLAVGSRE